MHHCFSLTLHSNHGLSHTVSEIDGDFSRKSQYFPIPVYFAPPLKGFPLELGTVAGSQKNQDDGATGPTKKFDIFSSVDTMHQRDRKTDTGRLQRPRLHIASHRAVKALNTFHFIELRA